MSRPQRVLHVAASLLAIVAAALARATVADPYQIEVVVFERPLDLAVATEPTDQLPQCLARAQPPAGAGAISAPVRTVDAALYHLATEARALNRSGSDFRVLSHLAWQQDLTEGASGPWVRIGGGSDAGLSGCLRARLTPVPRVELELVREDAAGELYAFAGSARIRPGDVHYFDHPALGILVRVDSLAPAPDAGPGAPVDPASVAPASPPAPAEAFQPPPPAASGPPGPPPPPPKKPFRW